MKKAYNYPKLITMVFDKEAVMTTSAFPAQSEYDRVINSLKDLGVDNNPIKVQW